MRLGSYHALDHPLQASARLLESRRSIEKEAHCIKKGKKPKHATCEWSVACASCLGCEAGQAAISLAR